MQKMLNRPQLKEGRLKKPSRNIRKRDLNKLFQSYNERQQSELFKKVFK